MKPALPILSTLGLLTSFAIAGSVAIDTAAPAPIADAFANARRPISNPTLFDLALPTTNVHPLFIYHGLPDNINTTAGKVPLGGDVEVYALQLEYALNERLSLVATKDGYVDMNPDNTLSHTNGWGNIAAGAKYAFLYDPAAGTAVSGTLTVEFPTGNHDVFQGAGDGSANLLVSGLKMLDKWEFAGGTGLILPFNSQQSLSGWMSGHVSYEVCPWFIPLAEINWFHVISAGDGTDSGVVPQIAKFEGGDYFNLGAKNAEDNRDLVTAAIGFRSRLCKSVDMGLAYEIPLTDKESSLMEERVTLDFVWKF